MSLIFLAKTNASLHAQAVSSGLPDMIFQPLLPRLANSSPLLHFVQHTTFELHPSSPLLSSPLPSVSSLSSPMQPPSSTSPPSLLEISQIAFPPHRIVTHSMTGVLQPKSFSSHQLYFNILHPLKAFHANHLSSEPTTFAQVVKCPKYKVAMDNKFNALLT